MARKEFHKVWQGANSKVCAPGRWSRMQVVVAMLSLGVFVLLLEYALLPPGNSQHATFANYMSFEVEEGADLYPDEIIESPLAENVGEPELVHLSLLHQACLTHKDSVIPWTYGLHGKVASPSGLLNKDDPNLIDKIRQCPDVDIFLPLGIRGHGYCEDSIAYTKFLQSRMLPAWAIEMKYYDKVTDQTLTYHDLCPKTPMIFFNHYWDGIPNSPDWPLDKPLYLMPNIEMYELQAKHYWGVDVVLCKTAICARRVRMWYEQEGNPRNTKVIYTRHTSSDVATFAKNQLGADTIESKNFSDVQFIHAVGTSVQKGTRIVLDCWLKRPSFPKLTIYMHPDVYSDEMKAAYDERIKKSQVSLELGRIDANAFGKIIAEAAFFLCTSMHEGYGHYINQARASGAVIVTTDVPPMNEFLTPASGVLVNSRRRIFKQQLLGGGFEGEYGLKNVPGFTALFGSNDVCDAVERIIKMTPEAREAMAERAKKQYFIDMNFFAHKMKELRVMARKGGKAQNLRAATTD
uniref:Glycosyl transferase family 1 domain-containing protein n=1 Tax=Globisporangium ultimum (strain ATCC 200006 / CBS 805.95 / DAOM BR144) TaxID=431595 RepID=K3WTA4_GLOUD